MTRLITIRGRLDQFQDRGFIVRYNPMGDGNCQFSAISYLLNKTGLHTSPRILRQNVVEYLRCNPTNNVGHLKLFLDRPSKIYLHEMKQDGTYEDLVMLKAISDMYPIQICVLSTLGIGADVDIQPQVKEAHPASPQTGGTYRMRYGKLSLKCFFTPVSLNGRITFAVCLMLCIKHVIVAQH